MEIILMENIGKLGKVGDLVDVKPGYARNYLFPMKKALRANKANKEVFESQKSEIQKRNSDAEQKAKILADKLKGLDFNLIRQAGETGRLYGSVSARDIAEEINKKFKSNLNSHSIRLISPLKEIGIFPVSVVPFGEIKVNLRIVIAQSEEEAKILLSDEKDEIAKEKKQAENDAKNVLEAKEKAKIDAEKNEAELENSEEADKAEETISEKKEDK